MRFQDLTSLALQAHYGGSPIFDTPQSLKLATLIVSRNELFSRDMSMRGHLYEFTKQADQNESEDEEEDEEADDIKDEEADSSGLPPLDSDDAKRLLSDTKPPIANRYTCDFEDLNELLQPRCEPIRPKSSDIIRWLEGVYKGSRGFELGTFDSAVVPIIWKQQSAHWDDLALGYISDVICLVHRFHEDLLRSCCSDERVLMGIESVLSDHLMKRYKSAIDHVNFVLFTERDGTPLTTNHYFANNLEKRYA